MQKISVIVPFYNAEKYLRSCITALLSQDASQENYEVILVDNNSTDSSVAIAKQFPRVKVLSESRQGAYAARNTGLAEARGEIIAFTDADCLPDRDWLRNMGTTMQSAQVRLVLGSRLWAHKPSALLSMLETYENQKVEFMVKSHIKELYYGYTNNMAVQREVFDTLGPFEERSRGADTLLVRRTIDAYSYEAVCYAPSVRVRHLEIGSVWKHYQKMWVYGRSNLLSGREVFLRSFNYRERPLNRHEAQQVFEETVRREGYSKLRTRLLAFLTMLEACAYLSGQWAARWHLYRHSRA